MLLLSQSPTLFMAWIIWCLGHSLPASRRVKSWTGNAVAYLTPQRYRLGYVLFSVLTLVPLLIWQGLLPAGAEQATFPWQVFRIALLSYAAAMFYLGAKSYNLGELLGLTIFKTPDTSFPALFLHTGVLGKVRHPWYSGGIAFLIATENSPGDRWDWRLLLVAYLIFGCLIEERRLEAEFGQVYREYQQQVPMLFPRLGKTPKSRL